MKITCHACGAKYAIADEKVRGRRVKVRCKSCNEPIIVDGYNELAGGTEDEQITAAVPKAPASSAGGGDVWSVNLSDTDQRSMTTNEVVAAWNAGQLPGDAYVWREGMDDWIPLPSAPELSPYLSQPLHSAPAQPAAQPVFGSAPFGAQASAARQQPAAARVSGGRVQVTNDLFGGAARAGSEEEVVSSASGPASTPYDEHKPTGARNENSVLFSLDALKAGMPGVPAGKSPQASPSRSSSDDKANLDDIMNLGGGSSGGGALFGLGQNQALLNAPPPPPEPPPRREIPSEAGIGGSIAPASLMPPAKSNKMVFIVGGAVGLLAVVAIVIGLVAIKSGKSADVAKAEMAEKAKGDKGSSGTSDDKKSDDQKKSDDDKSGSTASDPAASGSAKVPVTEEDKKRYAEAMKKQQEEKDKDTTKPDDTKKPDDSTATKDNPSSGVASFNKGAAISALGAAAAQASGCKRPGGPTGSGKAVVTFAPSGRVTTANVTGGDFPGTPVGSCVASVFRRAQVPAFSGDAVTVAKSFTISP